MKIVFFVRDLGLGGVERCVTLVSEGLIAHGFEVSIVMLGGNRNLWATRTGSTKIIDLSATWQGKKPWTWLAGWRAARQQIKDADILIAATFLMPLYMAYAVTRGLKTRVMGWVHGPLFELDQFATMNPIHRRACQYIYRRLNELVFVSEHARDSLARWLKQPIGDNWQVLPNFVDEKEAKVYPEKPASHTLQLLFVGRIAVEKQPHLWLDTLECLNKKGIPTRLTIVGDGPLEDWLKNSAKARQLDQQISFAGHQSNVGDYLAAADVLLLTSSFEGCPLVVLEAMPLGVVVASTNAGGVYELFGKRRSEFVVETASGKALAELIATQHRPELSIWLKQRAKHYSSGQILQQWINLCLDSKNPKNDL
ncbi:glycosyltransferase [Iodobacter fluviatilis]|uniref:Glycogen synthase n=1 Tax=Iodobacter fluviatilis TaxID=537 RepID=A0A377SWC6_9NEIS|nr:glycosyltransferase [Iodobacter fluviatilis]TCU88120.1 glycosyltransferase involved in cell wall biosynthesis [Iodobacter fluviatilis]STR45620.1 Glycogen synthase [Iodobacter fluviatilis]